MPEGCWGRGRQTPGTPMPAGYLGGGAQTSLLLLLLSKRWPEASLQDGLFCTHKASYQAEMPLHRTDFKLQHVKSAAKEWLLCTPVCKCTGKIKNRGRNPAPTTSSASAATEAACQLSCRPVTEAMQMAVSFCASGYFH